MSDEWYYLDGEKPAGPYPAILIRTALDTRDLSPDTLIWRAGMDTWTPIRSRPEIFPPSIPPPPPRVAVLQGGPTELTVPRPFRVAGSYVYLAEGYQLPDSHCVCCGLPSTKRYRKAFGFTPPGVWFAIVIPLVLVILFCCLHKSRSLRFGLCDEHAKTTLIRDIICWTCGLGFIPLFLIAGLFGAIPLVTFVVFCYLPRPLKIVGLENGYIKLNGVCNALKQSLRG